MVTRVAGETAAGAIAGGGRVRRGLTGRTARPASPGRGIRHTLARTGVEPRVAGEATAGAIAGGGASVRRERTGHAPRPASTDRGIGHALARTGWSRCTGTGERRCRSCPVAGTGRRSRSPPCIGWRSVRSSSPGARGCRWHRWPGPGPHAPFVHASGLAAGAAAPTAVHGLVPLSAQSPPHWVNPFSQAPPPPPASEAATPRCRHHHRFEPRSFRGCRSGRPRRLRRRPVSRRRCHRAPADNRPSRHSTGGAPRIQLLAAPQIAEMASATLSTKPAMGDLRLILGSLSQPLGRRR